MTYTGETSQSIGDHFWRCSHALTWTRVSLNRTDELVRSQRNPEGGVSWGGSYWMCRASRGLPYGLTGMKPRLSSALSHR